MPSRPATSWPRSRPTRPRWSWNRFLTARLLKIFTAEGAQVPIGAALCAIGQPGEKVEAPAAAPAAPALETKAPAPAPATPSGRETRRPGPGGSRGARAGPRFRRARADRRPPEDFAAGAETRRGKGRRFLPVTGSGPGGRIVRDDILAAMQSLLEGAKTTRVPQGGAQIQEEKSTPVSNTPRGHRAAPPRIQNPDTPLLP